MKTMRKIIRKHKAKNKIKIKMLRAVNKIRLLISWANRILQIIIKIPTILHSKVTKFELKWGARNLQVSETSRKENKL